MVEVMTEGILATEEISKNTDRRIEVSPIKYVMTSLGVPGIKKSKNTSSMYQQLKEEGKREVDEIKWVYAGKKVIDIYHKVMQP